MNARRNLCDDWGRLRFDELRIHARNVLVKGQDGWHIERDEGLLDWVDTGFQHKNKDGEWTREEPCNILAEPFFSQMPAKKH